MAATEALTAADIAAIISRIAGVMAQNRDELLRLDAVMGDGDLGITMEKGFAAAREEAAKPAEKDVGKLLSRIGMTIARSAPSTMGTLVATGFMAGGKAVAGKTALSATDLAEFFGAFTTSIMQRGKAQPGEKTPVDVLLPASQAMAQAAASGAGLERALEALAAAAAEGRARVRDMVARHGRQAYYQEQSKGREDAGSVACQWILQAFADHVRLSGS